MLVLSRKENESIEFPALGVVIRVFGLTRRRVQLGIEAPISLQVTRSEKLSSSPAASESVDSIAEYVMGEEFSRLQSEVSALAELSAAGEASEARAVAGDALNRITRLRRTVSAALRRQRQQNLR